MELNWFCTGVHIKSKASIFNEVFMNYSACWRSKMALTSIRCLSINTRANRVTIVCYIITRIFNPLQVLGSHISTLSNKDTRELFYVVNNARCQLILLLLFNYYSSFVQLSCSALFYEIILFNSISLFSFHVHPVNIQLWSWIVFQLFWSR